MMLSEILTIVGVLRAVVTFASPVLKAVRGPLLTVATCAALAVLVVAVREDGLNPGLRLLLVDPHEPDTMQRELKNVARRDTVLDSLLQAALQKAPTAARIRLAMIHNGEIGLTGVGLLRFDVTHAAARQGYAVGDLVANKPLSDWNPYLSKFLLGDCSFAPLEVMGQAELASMLELGVAERLACPVLDFRGRLLGGLFITWPVGVRLPEPEELPPIIQSTKLIAAQVAAAMAAGEKPH